MEEQQQEPRVLVGRDEAHKHINLSIHDICPNGHLLVNFLRAHIQSDKDAHAVKEVWPRTWVHESRTRIAIRTQNDEDCEKGKHYVEVRDLIDEKQIPFCELRIVKMTVAGEQEVAKYERLTTAEFMPLFEKIYVFLNTCGDWA